MVTEWGKEDKPFGGAGQVEYAEHSAFTRAKKVVEVAPCPVVDGSRWKIGAQAAIGTALTLEKNKAYQLTVTKDSYIVLWDIVSGITTPVPGPGDFFLAANQPIVIQTHELQTLESTLVSGGPGIIQAVEVK